MRIKVAHVQEERIAAAVVADEARGRVAVDLRITFLLRPVDVRMPMRRDVAVVGAEGFPVPNAGEVERGQLGFFEGVILSHPAGAVAALLKVLQQRARPREQRPLDIRRRSVHVRILSGEARFPSRHANRPVGETVHRRDAFSRHVIEIRRARIRAAKEAERVAAHLVAGDEDHVRRRIRGLPRQHRRCRAACGGRASSTAREESSSRGFVFHRPPCLLRRRKGAFTA